MVYSDHLSYSVQQFSPRPTERCMKILWIGDGGLASCGLAPAHDQHSRCAEICALTRLHHGGHHHAASLQ